MRRRLLTYIAAALAAAAVAGGAIEPDQWFTVGTVVLAADSTVSYVAEGDLMTNSEIHWKLDQNGELTISGTGAVSCENEYPWTAYNRKISSVVVEEGVTEIGDKAFDACRELSSVTLPESLKKIGMNAFSRCPKLCSICIPAAVRQIGGSAFAHSGLLGITFCGDAPEMGDDLFEGVSKLKIFYPGSSAGWTVEDKERCSTRNCSWIAEDQTSGTCGENLTWSFSNGVLSIEGTGCMDDFHIDYKDGTLSLGYSYPWSSIVRAITKVEIGDRVAGIGNMAFALCDQITEVSIGESVNYIGDNAFNGCTSLKEIRLPLALTEVREYAFSGCNHLETVYCSENLVKVENNAFKGCAKLRKVYYGAGQAMWNKVNIGYSGNNSLMTAKITFDYVENESEGDQQEVVEGTLNSLFQKFLESDQ